MEPGSGETQGTSGTEGATVPETPPPPGRSGLRWDSLRRLSDRWPLRTKLITAVLALVMLALTAISIASVYVLRENLITQHDSQVASALNGITFTRELPPRTVPGYVNPNGSGQIVAIQVPGQQLAWQIENGGFLGNNYQEPLPQLPTSHGWADNLHDKPLTVRSQSGPESWRIMAQTVPYEYVGTPAVGTLVVAVDLGNVNGTLQRIIIFDVLVSLAIPARIAHLTEVKLLQIGMIVKIFLGVTSP